MTGIQYNLDAALIRPGDKCEIVQMRPDDPLRSQILGKRVVVKQFVQGRYWLLEEPIEVTAPEDMAIGRDNAAYRFMHVAGSKFELNAVPAQYLQRVKP